MKKKLIAISLVVAIVAILSIGSLAWFSDSDSVQNNFMVARSTDDNPDDVFSVDVYELKPDGSEEQTGLDFPDVLPGDELDKPAYVRNTGYYDQYIRVIVTISDAPAWLQVLTRNDQTPPIDNFNDAELLAVFGGFDQSKWHHITTEVYSPDATDHSKDVIRIVMYYNEILPGAQTTDAESYRKLLVFDKINIPEEMERQHVPAFDDDGVEGFTVSVRADAVQTQNVVPEGTAPGQEAFAAFRFVNWMEDFPV